MSQIDMVEIIIVLNTHCISVLNFSVHNQWQVSKTISKNKSTHSLINNCCETHFTYCLWFYVHS